MLYIQTKSDYSNELFERMDCKIDSSKSAEYYELIIENGFLLYTLIELYIQHRGKRYFKPLMIQERFWVKIIGFPINKKVILKQMKKMKI